MDLADVEQLIDIFKDAEVSELTISTGTPQSTIKLRKTVNPSRTQTVRGSYETAPATGAKLISSSDAKIENEMPAGIPIKAQVVGIFHTVGSIATVDTHIKAGQVVGSIESMKLMNDVAAKCDGIVSEVLVEDGMPVEYGQTLFVINPAS